MAGTYIEFDAETIIGRLNIIEKTQLPYAGKQALKRLGYEIRQDVRKYMGETFENPVPFTLSSIRYDAKDLELRLAISKEGSKGQDPARYLYPVSTQDTTGSKPAYTTRFTRAIKRRGVIDADYYPIPWLEGRGVPTNSYGNVPPGFYQSVLAGLARYGVAGGKRTKQAGYRIFSAPDNRLGELSLRRTGHLIPGIYRAKGRDLNLLFGYSRRPPLVRTSFDLDGYIRRRSNEVFPTLLRQELSKALS